MNDINSALMEKTSLRGTCLMALNRTRETLDALLVKRYAHISQEMRLDLATMEAAFIQMSNDTIAHLVELYNKLSLIERVKPL